MFDGLIKAISSDPGMALGAWLGTLGILAVTAISISSVVAWEWRAWKQTEDENSLKLEMIRRGMSPDEIAQVIQGRGTSILQRAGRHFGGFCGPGMGAWGKSRRRHEESTAEA